MARFVTVEERGDVALVKLDRPPANALDPELLEEGAAVVAELTAAEPGAVVLTGRDGYFSAGVDLKVVPALDEAGQRAMVDGINGVFLSWYGFPRPVVCAVNGHAIAGGLILALCGDHRIGSAPGKLGLTELRVGLGFPLAAITVVRSELAPAAVRRLVLRTELLEIGPEAIELGLLDELAAANELLDRAFDVAGQLATLPPATYARVKEQLRGETVAGLRAALDAGADPLSSAWLSDETAGAASVLRRPG